MATYIVSVDFVRENRIEEYRITADEPQEAAFQAGLAAAVDHHSSSLMTMLENIKIVLIQAVTEAREAVWAA